MKSEKSFIEIPAFFFKNRCYYFHSCCFQFFNSFSINFFERIFATDYYFRNSMLNNQISTGCCFTKMSAGTVGNTIAAFRIPIRQPACK